MVPGNVIGMASHSGWKLIRQGRRTPIVIPLQEELQRITSREIEYTTYHPIEPPKNASSWSVVPESPLIPSPAGPPVPDGVVWVLGSWRVHRVRSRNDDVRSWDIGRFVVDVFWDVIFTMGSGSVPGEPTLISVVSINFT